MEKMDWKRSIDVRCLREFAGNDIGEVWSVFIVHHHCLRRRINRRSLLQNNNNDLYLFSMVRGTKADFQRLLPRSKEKHSPLHDSLLADEERESFENGRVSGLLYAGSRV